MRYHNRLCSFILSILLLFSCKSALAAKARSISSDTDSTYHSEHLRNHLGEIGCHATGNYIKTRSKANGNKVIGHLEQADEFILLDVKNGWVQIEVVHSDKTSPDSWKGMTGWVDSDYVDCACTSSAYLNNTSPPTNIPQQNNSWKIAYRQYLSENSILHNLDNYAVFWLAYIDNDSIPELIIDTTIVAGGCHVLTYHNGIVDSLLIGSTGIPSYIEKKNLLLDSAGHQGNYYDTVYTIANGKWKQVYHAENYEYPSFNYDVDQRLIHTYHINKHEVSKEEYHSVLNKHFDTKQSIRLINGTSIKELMKTLE